MLNVLNMSFYLIHYIFVVVQKLGITLLSTDKIMSTQFMINHVIKILRILNSKNLTITLNLCLKFMH